MNYKKYFLLYSLLFFFHAKKCEKSETVLKNEEDRIKNTLRNVSADQPIDYEDNSEELKYYKKTTCTSRRDKLIELLDITPPKD